MKITIVEATDQERSTFTELTKQLSDQFNENLNVEDSPDEPKPHLFTKRAKATAGVMELLQKLEFNENDFIAVATSMLAMVRGPSTIDSLIHGLGNR